MTNRIDQHERPDPQDQGAGPLVKDAAWWTEWHLCNWRDWMRSTELPDGVPDHACGGAENYTTFDTDSECAIRAHDAWAAEITNAIIEGLSEVERAAIHHAYLHATFRFPHGNYAETLVRAKSNVQAGLKRRGVWLGE